MSHKKQHSIKGNIVYGSPYTRVYSVDMFVRVCRIMIPFGCFLGLCFSPFVWFLLLFNQFIGVVSMFIVLCIGLFVFVSYKLVIHMTSCLRDCFITLYEVCFVVNVRVWFILCSHKYYYCCYSWVLVCVYIIISVCVFFVLVFFFMSLVLCVCRMIISMCFYVSRLRVIMFFLYFYVSSCYS